MLYFDKLYLEQVQEHADDAPEPGHQGAGPHGLVPDHGGEHLGRVDEHDAPHRAGPELADKGQKHLHNKDQIYDLRLSELTDNVARLGSVVP